MFLRSIQIFKNELIFDNFFTRYNLLENFACHNVKAVGTVRKSRTLGATKKMKTFKGMKISDKDSFDFWSDDKVYFSR